MRVLICPAAFRESLSASEAARAIAAGVRRAEPEADVQVHPLSDGGSDLVDALLETVGGRVETTVVTGPLGEPVPARVLWLSQGDAVIGTADVCGLDLVPSDRRDPGATTTRGVGELLAWCAERGPTSISIGLGGSGTVDGGAGMAMALGFGVLDDDGRSLGPGGAELVRLAALVEPGDNHPLADVRCTALADVSSPLFGPDGAARRFGPQKGAGPVLVELLDDALRRLAERWRVDLGADVETIPGAGAAGGLGAGCVAFLGADLQGGAEWYASRTGLRSRIQAADLVITGEGRLDAGSRLGKGPWHAAQLAGEMEVPCLYLAGRIDADLPVGASGASGEGAWLDGGALADLAQRAVGDLSA